MTAELVNDNDASTFQKDGVVVVRGLFKDFVELIREGIEFNMKNPGPYAAENLKAGESGRFFDDYCNWSRIPQFKHVITESQVGKVASSLMSSKKVQVFHDHVLVKEPGTSKPTPWHQDGPYYFIDGIQNVSFWSPVDPVTEASLRCVAGSHLWSKPVLPTRWLSEENFYLPTSKGKEVYQNLVEQLEAYVMHFDVFAYVDLEEGVFGDPETDLLEGDRWSLNNNDPIVPRCVRAWYDE